MESCKRCGKCCYIYLDGNKKKCKYLVPVGNNRYACRVYKTRLDKVIAIIDDKKVFCRLRKDSPIDYPGCPFNTDKEVKQ